MSARFRLLFACSLSLASASGLFSAGCGGMVDGEGPGFKAHDSDSGPDPYLDGGVPVDAGPGRPHDDGGPQSDAEPPYDGGPGWDDGGEWWDAGQYDGGTWWDAGQYDGGQWWDAGPYDAGQWWDAGEWPDVSVPTDASWYDAGEPWVDASWPDAQPPGSVLPTGCDPSNVAGALDAWLAFDAQTSGVAHIFVIRPNGCDVRQLTFGTSNEREPAFSPDGAYLTFSSDRGGSTQIWRMDLTTGALVQLTKSATNARHSAWSPDGARITFASDDGIVWTMGSDGSNLTRVAQDGDRCCSAYRAPIFSHDGTQILFDRYNEIDAVHLDGTAKRYVVSNWTTEEGNPEMAPNGLRVAYDVYCGAGPAIFTAPYTGLPGDPCSGGRITPDAFGPSANPAWGPNSLFAFERTSSGRLAIIDATTGAAWEVLDESSLQTNPTWAPAGWQPH